MIISSVICIGLISIGLSFTKNDFKYLSEELPYTFNVVKIDQLMAGYTYTDCLGAEVNTGTLLAIKVKTLNEYEQLRKPGASFTATVSRGSMTQGINMVKIKSIYVLSVIIITYLIIACLIVFTVCYEEIPFKETASIRIFSYVFYIVIWALYIFS